MERNLSEKPLFTPQFFVLCLSSLLFFMSFNSILPELVIYLDEELNAIHLSGWIIAAFTAVAGLSRPISGKMTDQIGRIPVIVFGAAVAGVAAFAYIFVQHIATLLPFLGAVGVFFVIRAFHGLSTGFKPTATAALLSDLLPESRVGEGMGWLGFAGSLGMALGPKLGNYLHLNYGYDYMFMASALLSLLSVIVIFGLDETLPKEQRRPLSMDIIKITKDDVIEPKVIHPALVFVFYATAYGAVLTLIPLKTKFLGLDEFRGTFFVIYLGSTGLSRVLAGKVSDKLGRLPVLVVGTFLVALAMVILAYASDKSSLLTGGALYGIAHGIVSPSLYAWTSDLSPSQNKGKGFSTMFIGMEIGIGMGALLSSWVYNVTNSLLIAMLCIACFSLIAFFYSTVCLWKQRASSK